MKNMIPINNTLENVYRQLERKRAFQKKRESYYKQIAEMERGIEDLTRGVKDCDEVIKAEYHYISEKMVKEILSEERSKL